MSTSGFLILLAIPPKVLVCTKGRIYIMTGFADPCFFLNISQDDSLLCLGSTWQKKWNRVLEMIPARSVSLDRDTD